MIDRIKISPLAASPTKKDLIFISCGDNEVFLTYAIQNLLDYFDIAVFYYGKNNQKIKDLENLLVLASYGTGTKFNIFKELYFMKETLFCVYETIWLVDDDATYIKGEISKLPDMLREYNLKIISPAQDTRGRMSHNIMRPHFNRGKLRFVNFIEMGWPMFSKEALRSFLLEYDNSLYGAGIDIWYCNHLKLNSGLHAAIVDDVVFLNPYEKTKAGAKRELDNYTPFKKRVLAWQKVQKKRQFDDWEHRNLLMGKSIKDTPLPINLFSLVVPLPLRPPLRKMRDLFNTVLEILSWRSYDK